MILRIVKLDIIPEEVEDFIHFFNEHKAAIASSKGCHLVELYKDVTANEKLITYSIWEDTEALERYRDSDLFKTIWPKAKKVFKSKPKAYSYKYIESQE